VTASNAQLEALELEKQSIEERNAFLEKDEKLTTAKE
jgi:hypothetical protein